jgi:4-alpha-glucanotransferase
VTDTPLRARATQLGVETSYWDVAGGYHEASDETLLAIVDVLEADAAASGAGASGPPVVVGRPDRVAVGAATDVELELADGTALALPIVDGHVAPPPDLPIGCHRVRVAGAADITLVVAPPAMPRAAALAGRASLFVPAYALWGQVAPLPSFANLAAFATSAQRLGIDVVTTLPLYAAFLDEPFDPSPYAPVSRLHWNELYIDDATLPAAEVPVLGDTIDWRELAVRRRRQLLAMVADLDPYVETGITRFVAAHPDVADYARFRSARPEAGDAGAPAALVERSHILAQYLADRQLAAVEGPGRAALALDLPIGSHIDGYETSARADLFAAGMTVGAPPDEFFADGQDWGFPPQLPAAGRRSGHALWRGLVARAGAHASLLRIDHVMGVHRLWWVPEGRSATEGAYVRYPREELLAVIAAEAARTGTTIVGEDLGTVPDEVRDALERWDVLGMYEEQFHVHRPLPPIPARTVAGVRTHDMPAFAAVVRDDPSGLAAYREHAAAALDRPVGDGAGELLDAALERLAASDAYLVVADLDDLLGETSPHNVPGRVLPSTWRRRLPRPTSAVLADLDVRRRVKLLATRGADDRDANSAGGDA